MTRSPIWLLAILLAASVRAEFPVSELAAGPRVGGKGNPHVVRVDAGYLVAWGESSGAGRGWIAASLVAGDGQLNRIIDPVSRAQGFPLFPGTIAASGNRVLIPGECLSPKGTRSVCITWIDVDDGVISQPQLIEEDAVSPSAAWNGRVFLLTYVSRPFSERVLRARVIPLQGDAGEPTTLGPWNPFSHTPSVTASGESFYVAWHSSQTTSLLAAVVGDVVRFSEPLETPTQQVGLAPHLSVTSSAGELLVVTGQGSLRRFRDLVPLTPWTSIGRSRHLIFHPHAVRTTTGWSIVFAVPSSSSYEVRAVSVGSDGTPGEEVLLGAAMPAFSTFDTVASASGFILAWSRARYPAGESPAESDVFVRSFGGLHDPKHDPKIVSIGVASQHSPVAAFGGGAYLVAWSERNAERWEVRAQKFALNGEAVGPPVEIPSSNEDQIRPAIDSDGDSFLLIWSEGPNGRSGVRGARIDWHGVVVDPAGIEIAGAVPLRLGGEPVPARSADVAWSGTNWIIASEEESGIGVRRLTPSGLLLDPIPVLLPRRGELQRLPVLDCTIGGDCLVASQTYIRWGCSGITCALEPDSVTVVRVTSHLEALDKTPQLLTEPGEGSRPHPRSLAVAWNESQEAWMVVWAGPAGRRVSRAGVLLDAPQIQWWEGYFASVVAEQSGWRVLWVSAPPEREGVLTASTATGFGSADLRQRLVVEQPGDDDRDISLAAGPRPLALYVRAEPELGGAHRIFGRWLDETPPVGRRRAVGRQ